MADAELKRASPDALLALAKKEGRGRLKIFLGAAPGVGKTYAMLSNARIERESGRDVVAGLIETHGRRETQQLVEGLEVLPRHSIAYRNQMMHEFDLDAALARRSSLLLVDEYAHTNVPGSRHPKRWQDVDELLNAGIDVWTTLNIQHLESLYDIVESCTGVKVKERVPDYILGLADQIVNVDLSAEDLQDRLRGGKVYPRERIDSALSNFFTEENLTRLREMALEEIRHLLDRRRQTQNTDAQAPSGRVMVCLSSRSPNPHVLLRKGARLADRLHSPWYAVYIKTPSEDLSRVEAATQRRIADTLALAHQLGAVPLNYAGPTFAAAVAEFVHEYGITHILLGRTQRPWYRRWFGQSPLDRLLRTVRGVDVVIVDTA